MQQYTDDAIIELLRSPQSRKRNEALRFLYQELYGGIARYVLNNSGTEADAKDGVSGWPNRTV